MMVQECGDHSIVAADVDLLHVGGIDVMLANEAHHLAHGRMRERARGIGLDGNARGGERPGITQALHDRRWIEAATSRMEESVLSFEDVGSCRPAERG